MKGSLVSNTGPIIALSAISYQLDRTSSRDPLGQGRSIFIQLARETGADFVLIDERKARKIARKIYGINVVGSARILLEAKHRGLIPKVREALEGMRSAGYWIHDDIMKTALEQAHEK
jgi:predicted nucleic acid-binding protein